MDEKRIRKNLRRATFLVVLAGVLLLTAGGLVTHYLRGMLRSTVNTQMETETKEYKERLQQRIKTDFQTLYTLSGFWNSARPWIRTPLRRGSMNPTITTILSP